MSRRSTRRVGSLSLFVLVAASTVSAQTVFRLGSEFQVNVRTVSAQGFPSVAREPDGDFVVLWHDYVGGAHSNDVLGRRFNSAGTALGTDFVVSVYTVDAQSVPKVAIDPLGRFVATWAHRENDIWDIRARRFDAAGIPQGGEVQVNTYTPGSQIGPDVAMDSDGDFVVVWLSGHDGSNFGVFGRRFNSAGAAQGAEFQVNLATAGYQADASVDMESDGDFVVVWTNNAEDPKVRARRFTSAGAGGVELPVRTFTGGGGPAIQTRVSLDGDGNFVVVWHDDGDRDGSGAGVFARRMNALGGPEGPEFQVNTYTPDDQGYPDVVAGADGSFVVAWPSYLQDGSSFGAFLRAFDSAGQALSGELQISAHTVDWQANVALAMRGDHDFVVAFQKNLQDGDDQGIFAQRFAALAMLDVDGNGDFDALTDGLLILRFGFGFTGNVLSAGAVSPGCTRCDPASIKAYLDSVD